MKYKYLYTLFILILVGWSHLWSCTHPPLTNHAKQLSFNELSPPQLERWLTHSKLSKDIITDEWISCLEPLFLDYDRSVDLDHLALPCKVLLSRPSDQPRPPFLNRNWLILDVKEDVRPSIDIQAKVSSPSSPLHSALNKGSWTIQVSLLRLPSDPTFTIKNKRTLSETGVPPPLVQWKDATVLDARQSEWGTTELLRTPILLKPNSPLKALKSPRVGQVLHLTLSKRTPSIQYGGWAFHHSLWFSVPVLRRSFVLSLPHRLKIAQFGTQATQSIKASHEIKSEWRTHFLSSGEGGSIYLTSTNTWKNLHSWFWSQFAPAVRNYQRVVTQQMSQKAFTYFLNKRSTAEIYRWINQHFNYTPNVDHPYQPKPILDLLKTRQGDCKDFSVLSHVLLNTQGELSFLALASSKPIPSVAFKVPSVGWFDHVLVWQPSSTALKLAQLAIKNGKTLLEPGLTRYAWLDATAPQLKPQLQSSWAYVLLNKKQGIWVPTHPRRP